MADGVKTCAGLCGLSSTIFDANSTMRLSLCTGFQRDRFTQRQGRSEYSAQVRAFVVIVTAITVSLLDAAVAQTNVRLEWGKKVYTKPSSIVIHEILCTAENKAITQVSVHK
jgi:hypothetical protein